MIATYAPYVWSCYGITAAILIYLAWSGHRGHIKELRAARKRQAMRDVDAAAEGKR